jgi:Fe-S-cluster containining protein
MSLCDQCFAPGQCCKSLNLIDPHTREAVSTWAGDGEAAAQMKLFGLPFEVADTHGPWIADETSERPGKEYVIHRWRCPLLNPDGRCGDYENRPTLCRSFEPALDRLCVHYHGAEAGDPTLGFDLAQL